MNDTRRKREQRSSRIRGIITAVSTITGYENKSARASGTPKEVRSKEGRKEEGTRQAVGGGAEGEGTEK